MREIKDCRRNDAMVSGSHPGVPGLFPLPLPAPASPAVFIIDNDLAVLSALAFAFEADGFRAFAFRTPARADRSVDLASAACIILDQQLQGECGLDYLARLDREGRRRPAILIPTAPTLSVRLLALDMAVPIIEKPLLDDALFQAVRTLVSRPLALARL